MKLFNEKLCLVLWLNVAWRINSQTVLLTRFKDKCITNSFSAIAHTYDNLSNIVLTTSFVVFPGFTLSKQLLWQSRDWQINQQCETGNDRFPYSQWESFPAYSTKAGAEPILVASNNIAKWFSVQTEKEANIFLCGDRNPLQYCYWINLQRRNATIRRCNVLQNNNFEELASFCNKINTVKVKELMRVGWNHFQIKITEGIISLHNQQGDIIWMDKLIHNLNYMLFHTKTSDGLWKLHKFSCAYSAIENSDLYISNLKQLESKCFIMFTRLCVGCELELLIKKSYWSSESNAARINGTNNWEEKKICFPYNPSSYYYLLFRTRVSNPAYQNGAFWAITNLRTSSPDELRILFSDTGTGDCQLVENGLTIDRTMETIEENNKCREDEFGADCTKCSTVFSSKYCPEESKYCQLSRNSNGNIIQKCYCSGGYGGSACGKPTQPRDMRANWTKDNYLIIVWLQPSETNGLLKKFEISLNMIVFSYNITSTDDYRSRYKLEIKENLSFPDKYTINICAENSKGKSPMTSFIIASPPPIPKIKIQRFEDQLYAVMTNLNQQKGKTFKRYLYVLRTECESCRESIRTFYAKLIAHFEHNDSSYKEEAHNWITVDELSMSTLMSEYKINLNNQTFQHLTAIIIYKANGFVQSDMDILSLHGKDTDKGFKTSKNSEISDPFWIKVTAPIVIIICLLILLIWWINRKKYYWSNGTFLIKRKPTLNSIDHDYANMEEIELSDMFIYPGHPQFKTNYSKQIKLTELEDYVKKAVASGELDNQHQMICAMSQRPSTYGERPENKTKNRYQNLNCYDHSRVILQKLPNEEYSDYINANYIDGYCRPKAYIATQGPKENTVTDFWRMIWQEDVKYIIALANVIEGGKKKLEQYWPDVSKRVVHGDYTISHIRSMVQVNYEFRQFELKYHKSIKQVTQLHFKAWPDHGAPLYPQSLVPFLKRINGINQNEFPLVVHCSAGVGRTGVIILCDICLRMAASEQCVDVLSMIEHIRNARCKMVDNIVQYKLVYLTLINYLSGNDTSIPIDSNFLKMTKQMIQSIDNQLQHIRDCEWQEEVMRDTIHDSGDDSIVIVPDKNRIQDIIPEKFVQVYLYPDENDGTFNSTYINAIRVDGFCDPNRFIATQYPLPNTVSDFWRLIIERNISVVICLNEFPSEDNTFGQFFTLNGKLSVTNLGEIYHCKTKPLSIGDILNFEILPSNERYTNKVFEVKFIKFNGWSHSEVVPDATKFIAFVENAMGLARQSKPVLVACYDGTTGCGLFISMSFLIEKIKWEQEFDVCQAVRSIRTSRKQFVSSKQQMEFLYNASILYADSTFGTYSNVKNIH